MPTQVTQHIRSATVIDDRTVALQIDFETMRNPVDEQVGATFEDKRFLLRSQLNGEASAVLRTAGVAAPPTLRELP